MNRVTFGESACERTRKYLDSYISNELLVETNHEMLRHLEGCPECSAEAEARSQLRTRVRAAVRSQSAPAELPAKIRETIRSAEARKPAWSRMRLSLAAGAFAACAILWVSVGPERMPALGDRPAQNAYIRKISSGIASVLRVGLGDHVHCAVFRKKETSVPKASEMEKELGSSFRGLVPVVTAAVPAGYRIAMAHHCSYLGRQFVHLTLERGGTLVSLVIARKEDGESFAGLSPAAMGSAVPIYQGTAGRYHVAAFDAGRFLAYIVSDVNAEANLQITTALMPGVRELLLQTKG